MKILQELLTIAEADRKKDDEKKSTSRTKSKDKPDLSAFTNPKMDQPLSKREPDRDEKRSSGGDEPARKLRTASASKTAAASSNVRMDQRSQDHMSDLMRNMGDDDAEPETPTTDLVLRSATDVPAHVASAMVAAGMQDPDFHLVSNLPGNMKMAIKRLGQSLFGSLTKTKTDNIAMVGDLGGMGPNSPAEVNAVAGYLKKHGEDLGPGDIDFSNIMPGYKAKIHNWEADGVHFMMVKDQMGNYIYSWPAEDTLGRGDRQGKLSSDDKKRLN